MDKSVGQRIKEILRENGVTQVEVIKHLNWDVEERKSTVSYWLRQTDDTLYLKFIRGLLEILPQINPLWILTGEGEKLLSDQTETSKYNKPLTITQELNKANRNETGSERQLNRVIDMLEKQIAEKDKQINDKDKIINRLLSLVEENNKKKES